MEFTVELNVLIRFLLRTLAVFALIFLLAVVTPWIAKIVDQWIARYRRNHDPKKDETYGIRSIYELPPRSDDEDAAAEVLASDGQTADHGEVPESGTDAAGAPPAEDTIPWFRR